MIVRVFSSIELWEENRLEELPLCAISSWSSVNDNDCSVFDLPSFEEKDYKWIVLRVLAENFSKWGEGFDLFCINDQGIELLKLQICPDKENRLNCLHENISNIDYALFRELVSYTFDNKECVLQCGPSKIKNIIKDLSNEEFTSFINYYCDYQASKDGKPKPIKFINRIKNAYFESRIDECPEYVG